MRGWQRITGWVVAWSTLLVVASGVQAQTRVVPGGMLLAEAVAQAEAHDSLWVAAGEYAVAHLTIDKPLTILGEPGAILDGGGEPLVVITADSVTLQGLRFRNVKTSFSDDRAAIKVNGGHHCRLVGNRLEDTFFGIYLAQSSGCYIAQNTIIGYKETESRSGNGIHLWYSKNVRIAENTIRGHRDGIYLEFVEDSEAIDNVSERNHRYGLHFMFSDRCAYRRNLLRANGAGVAVMYTKEMEMTENHFIDNWGSAAYGVLLKDITDSLLRGNRFEGNTVGIVAEGSDRMTVEGNTFRQNGWAIRIMANASDNVFTRNAFVANTFDVATNSRQNYSTFAGNYWDQYEGYDLDRDGVGDVPFRPVRLFSLIVERNEPALILLRSSLVHLLDAAERLLPVLTPQTLMDETPAMRPF